MSQWSTGTPEPAFSEPWHAQLFALTVRLSEEGHFRWPTWAERFSSTLQLHGLDKNLDGGDDYFNAWLVTLEDLLAETGQAGRDEAAATKAAWEAAYRKTPHGEPVYLSD